MGGGRGLLCLASLVFYSINDRPIVCVNWMQLNVRQQLQHVVSTLEFILVYRCLFFLPKITDIGPDLWEL